MGRSRADAHSLQDLNLLLDNLLDLVEWWTRADFVCRYLLKGTAALAELANGLERLVEGSVGRLALEGVQLVLEHAGNVEGLVTRSSAACIIRTVLRLAPSNEAPELPYCRFGRIQLYIRNFI